MAKARPVEGLDPDMPFALAAARTVRVRADELRDDDAGVLDVDDPERVHAMRVTTRRLRAVLEVYAPCFPKKQLKPVLADVKALADALGARRDPDVQLLALDDLARSLPGEDGPGIELVAQEARAERERGNAVLAAALEAVRASDLHGRLVALADAAEADVAPPPDAPEDEDAYDVEEDAA